MPNLQALTPGIGLIYFLSYKEAFAYPWLSSRWNCRPEVKFSMNEFYCEDAKQNFSLSKFFLLLVFKVLHDFQASPTSSIEQSKSPRYVSHTLIGKVLPRTTPHVTMSHINFSSSINLIVQLFSETDVLRLLCISEYSLS